MWAVAEVANRDEENDGDCPIEESAPFGCFGLVQNANPKITGSNQKNYSSTWMPRGIDRGI
jgi:hypothetical protein